MTAVLTGPALPAELLPNEDTFAAYVRHGRREITWRFHHPDGHKLYGNLAAWAWFTLSERTPFAGEPLWVSTERRASNDGPRDSFTRAASDRIQNTVVPAVARYGFDRWWNEVHRATINARSVAQEAAAAARAARWTAARIEVRDLYAAGELDVKPLPTALATTTHERDARRKAVLEHGSTRATLKPVIAELHLHGEPFGWLTDDGEPIPLDHDLRGYWTR